MWLTFAVASGLVAIPVLIHLFNRTRYRRINWAAMEFLLNAYRKTRRRVQFENLLLLLLRVLAMAFLAFAFFPQGVESSARWFFDATGLSLSEGAGAGRAQHLILVVDDSGSMRYRLNRSSHDRAVEVATGMVGGLKEGRDRVTVIRASAIGETEEQTLSAQDVQRLNREIQAVGVKRALELIGQSQSGYGSPSLFPALREAARRVASLDINAELPRVAVISDFQKNAWAFAQPKDPQHEAFVAVMKDIDAVLNPLGISVSMHDVGPQTVRNYAITDLRLEQPVLGVGIPSSIRVSVGYFSGEGGAPEEFRLHYRIDQGEAFPFTRSVVVAPGKEVTLSQAIEPFATSGTHTIRVELEGEKAFEEDDARTLVVNVIEELPILIVNGAPSDDLAEDEAEYLRLALEIDTGEGEGSGRVTPNRVGVVAPHNLATRKPGDFAVVILANYGDPSEEFAQALEEYVRVSGGSVLFAMGDKIDLDRYNHVFWKDGSGLLPAKLVKREGLSAASGTERYRRILGTNLMPGSPLELFGERATSRALIEEPEVIATWVLADVAINPSDADSSPVSEPERPEVILNIDAPGKPPLLIRKQCGRGQCMLWTTTVDGDWNAMWQTSASVMPICVFHELVRHLAVGDSNSRNLVVGDHFVRLLLEAEQTGGGYRVLTPLNAEDRPVENSLADGRRRLTYTRTTSPGAYRLQFLALDAGSSEPSLVRDELFSVSMAGHESDVTRLGSGESGTAAPGAVIVESLRGIPVFFESKTESAVSVAPKTGHDRMDYWLLFVGLAALALLAEMAASLWFGRKAE